MEVVPTENPPWCLPVLNVVPVVPVDLSDTAIWIHVRWQLECRHDGWLVTTFCMIWTEESREILLCKVIYKLYNFQYQIYACYNPLKNKTTMKMLESSKFSLKKHPFEKCYLYNTKFTLILIWCIINAIVYIVNPIQPVYVSISFVLNYNYNTILHVVTF